MKLSNISRIISEATPGLVISRAGAAERILRMTTRNEAVITEKIVEALFTNGLNEKVHRLILELEDGSYGGGWSKPAVRNQIEKIFSDHSSDPPTGRGC